MLVVKWRMNHWVLADLGFDDWVVSVDLIDITSWLGHGFASALVKDWGSSTLSFKNVTIVTLFLTFVVGYHARFDFWWSSLFSWVHFIQNSDCQTCLIKNTFKVLLLIFERFLILYRLVLLAYLPKQGHKLNRIHDNKENAPCNYHDSCLAIFVAVR